MSDGISATERKRIAAAKATRTLWKEFEIKPIEQQPTRKVEKYPTGLIVRHTCDICNQFKLPLFLLENSQMCNKCVQGSLRFWIDKQGLGDEQ